MPELIAQILRNMVEHPGDVRVEPARNERGISMVVHVHPDDVGKVIGRDGRIINALRQIVRSSANGRGRQRINVELAA